MVRTTLRPDAESAAAARRFVADVLSQRGFSRSGIEDAVLMTSEAVTNVVVHAGTALDLIVMADARLARVEVHDADPTDLVPAPARPEEAAGLGLRVIDA
ncbi:MAG: ATP-binding protein, partial [Acidimicrobiales bacterium]